MRLWRRKGRKETPNTDLVFAPFPLAGCSLATRSRPPPASPSPVSSSLEDSTSIRSPSVSPSSTRSRRPISPRSLCSPFLAVRTPEDIRDQLDFIRTKLDCCLVIDGESLQLCLDHYQNEFIDLATQLSCVVACRCSPTQKADIARLIRSYTKKRVCCIGDGGNDVSMIQAADVGESPRTPSFLALADILIEFQVSASSERKGNKPLFVSKPLLPASLFVLIIFLPASQLAADFSITQFSFITKLLVWHGRNSYKRSSKLAQFVIHRGLIISVMQAVFSAIFYFAPIALYQGWLMIGYATFYTMAPVFSLVLDRDVNEDVALLYPELFKELTKVIRLVEGAERRRRGRAGGLTFLSFRPQGRSLSYKTFFTWTLISVYQGKPSVFLLSPPLDASELNPSLRSDTGGAIMIMSLLLFETEFQNIVAISFTALILNELIMVALEITTWRVTPLFCSFRFSFAD